jgi:S-DNA-T family DNA segregation ATPase FtsK/SpoIIIE
MSLEVKSSVMREIWAVIHLGLGFITLLSLWNNFGLAGEIWVGILKPILGWGINALPYMFFGSALMLFLAKEMAFPLSRILGFFFMTVSILGIFHLSVPMDEIYLAAQQGAYGGYVGFVTNFLLRQVLNVGSLGTGAIFVILFVISLLLTFEISLQRLFAFFNPQIRIVRKRGAAKGRNEEGEDDDIEDSMDEEDEELGRVFENDGEDEAAPLTSLKIHRMNDDEEGEEIAEKNPKTRVVPVKEEKEEALVEKEGGEYIGWTFPSMDLLNPALTDVGSDDALLKDNAEKIHDKLSQFGIEVVMHEVHVGPTVIQYTLRPHEGIKLSKITALKSDLALALAAKAVRIEAPIPGKSLVGIEVPNDQRSLVHLREILESKEYKEIESNLRLPLGRDVSGKPVCGDLASMPHLLIAGATGSGKSVGMNTFLISLIYQNSPADLRFIMIDPKRVELTPYNGIPHLLTPVITDPEKAAIGLRWAVAEMNRRYQLCAELGHKNIQEFNGCQEIHEEGRELPGHQNMQNIVIVIDELADLMMAAGKEVEASICRIAQMARAVGMHLIVATQRPSVDVITGLIKANIPARIAFAVSSSVDSRTILDGAGAEDLLGKGDMLYLPGGMSKPLRVQGIYVSTKEIERVINNIKIMAPANYVDDIVSPKVAQAKIQGVPESSFGEEDDESLYQQALELVAESRKASASLLQRRLKVGYARAARLLDMMEENGVIGPVNGAKPRDIYL